MVLFVLTAFGTENVSSSDHRQRIREEIEQFRESLEVMSIEAKKDPVTFELKRTYGKEYNRLSDGEKEYLKKNFSLIRRITQDVLSHLTPQSVSSYIQTNERNIVEFYLHTDGSISDQHCVKTSGYPILDDISLEVIDIAAKKYPRPLQTTLIHYSVFYKLEK